MQSFNQYLDNLSEFLSKRKGLVPLCAIVLVVLNYFVGFIPGLAWFAESDLLLHLGVIIGILGFMLAWAL